MVSAPSATKRRAGLNSGGTKKKAAKKAALGAKAAPAASSEAKAGMLSSATAIAAMKLAPQNASVSEKRRIAALISWEKRRSRTSDAKHVVVTTSKKKTTASKAVVRPVTPPKDKSKRVAAPSSKKRKTAVGPSIGKSSTAKVVKAVAAPKVEGRENDPASTKLLVRSQAAKMGWERRRNQQAASEIRSKAAKLGWERKKRIQIVAEGGSVGSLAASNASVATAAAANERSSPVATNKKAAAGASSKVGYSAAARRKAAVLGWEKRRNEKATRRVLSSGDAPMKAPLPSKPKTEPRKYTKPLGSKRSRRLAAEESGGTAAHDTEARRINELVTRLRLARGWMEFRPSSRHGSGTATYGYIPSSIASFIRSGVISQRTVLDKGALGVHYALDWEGYGGLKEMIDTFGEDFSPHPTEEMMKHARVPVWELGDDLPWREVEEADARNKLTKEEEKKKLFDLKEQEPDSAANAEDEDTEDILIVANILASLDGGAVMETCRSEECKHGSTQINSGPDNTEEMVSSDEHSPSASFVASKDACGSAENSPADGYNPASKDCMLSRLADVADVTVTKECKDRSNSNIVEEEVLIIQTRQDFKHWNFGLC